LKTFNLSTEILDKAISRTISGRNTSAVDTIMFLQICKFLSICKKTGKLPSAQDLARPTDLITSHDYYLHRQAQEAANQSLRKPYSTHGQVSLQKNMSPINFDATKGYQVPASTPEPTDRNIQQNPTDDLSTTRDMTAKDFLTVQSLIKRVELDNTGIYNKKFLGPFIESFQNTNKKKAAGYFKLVEPFGGSLTDKQMIIFCWYLYKDYELLQVPISLPQIFDSYIKGIVTTPVEAPTPVQLLYSRGQEQQLYTSHHEDDINPLTDNKTNPQLNKTPAESFINPTQPTIDTRIEDLVDSLIESLESEKAQKNKLIKALEDSQADYRRTLDDIKQATNTINKSSTMLSQLINSFKVLTSKSEKNLLTMDSLKSNMQTILGNSEDLIHHISRCSNLIMEQSNRINSFEQMQQRAENLKVQPIQPAVQDIYGRNMPDTNQNEPNPLLLESSSPCNNFYNNLPDGQPNDCSLA